MFFITRKQRKDMEAEQLKAVEREKEFQQSEILKAKLEIQVAERTAEILGQKEELQKALDKLKITQAQLIQSEKMASLGELTAGIAHEIQNPLNFVNNFSEVSSELLVEMNEEIVKGDFEEVKIIASDIKKNLEKINFHGKRADSIVKGMLQHSRTGSTIKEATDINKLADEYLRLAYHGLRAKDKSFNADLITDFDSSLPKINVFAQEIGRVLLNLFTNAFYATHQRQKKSGEAYKPTVSVTTALKDNAVEITVKDNGVGIPTAIKDKIMQPFFTTKPTGEGTGLGLSLSYDIVVKGHSGSISIDSRENDYTVFTILLPME
ncbi:two-component sensor histidine kinase [Flavobacterium sp. NAS39]|uniref:histidine kinase n=2 Tax=Flavobacterium taihuense TaxID=2857508 RepID=A0ABS6Y126_9FLAO|nr:two-component sensor histidine kinase [Flavobacterium taihuense]